MHRIGTNSSAAPISMSASAPRLAVRRLLISIIIACSHRLQARRDDGSYALGPCILLSREPLAKSTASRVEIGRGGKNVFAGGTTLAELKREPRDLAEYLFRDNSFPLGVFLMTGTGVVPADD